MSRMPSTCPRLLLPHVSVALLAGLAALGAQASKPASKPASRPASTPTSKLMKQPQAWDDLARLEAGSVFIIRGVLSGDLKELARASRKNGDYLMLHVQVREAIKQPLLAPFHQDVLGRKVSFRFYACPEDNNRYRFDPTLEDMSALLKKPKAERDVIVFLSRTGRHLYLTDRFGGAIVSPETKDIVSMRRRISRHRALRRVPTPVTDGHLDLDVKELIGRLDDGVAEQREALAELEALGKEAVPAIVRHMDDRRKLAEARIVLRNKARDRFERTRTYSPKLVVDALAAVLNQITGERFGLDVSRPTDFTRAQEVAGWRVYAHYPLATSK